MVRLLSIFVLVTFVFSAQFAPDPLLQKVEEKYGKFAKNRFIMLNKTLASLKDKNVSEKLNGVNDFFNQVPYQSDAKNYGMKDYWATPWEFLGRDKGDCEDYVIAKYFALKSLGIPPEKLYFTYAKSRRFKAPHMVLTYFETPRSVPLVLDNINFKIFPASQRRDLIPIYNFNGDALRIAGKQGQQGKNVKSTKTHKKWDQLLDDVQRNKL